MKINLQPIYKYVKYYLIFHLGFNLAVLASAYCVQHNNFPDIQLNRFVIVANPVVTVFAIYFLREKNNTTPKVA